MLAPLTSEEQETLKTYNTLSREWDSAHDTPGFWKNEMDVFQRHLPSGKILEIGCGGGRDARDLLQRGYHYVGTDIAYGLIKVAQQKFPDERFFEQSVYALSFPAGTLFDGFWCSAVLLHLPKQRLDEALQSIRRWMKPGAIGFISIKEGESQRLEPWVAGQRNLGRLFIYYSQKEFSLVFQRNKFILLEFIRRPMSEKTIWLSFVVRVAP